MKAQGRIVLASVSPRRREFFSRLGIAVEAIPSGIEEEEGSGDPAALAASTARRKVDAVRARLGPSFGGWLLGADTVVALGPELFGKPRDAADAGRMLRALSGRTHEVFTAYRVEAAGGEVREGTAVTQVEMAAFGDAEIAWYVASGEPTDKAGGYGIQGRGGLFVRAIRGSYSNVVGLPLWEVVSALRELGAVA